MTASGGDRNPVSNSEIETGPETRVFTDKPFYRKGRSTTTDRAVKYRQNIPWFATYTYGGVSGSVRLREGDVTEKIIKPEEKGEPKEISDKAKTDNEIIKMVRGKYSKSEINDLIDKLRLPKDKTTI